MVFSISKSGFGRETTRVGDEIRSPRDIATTLNVLSARPPISWSNLVSNIGHVDHEIPYLVENVCRVEHPRPTLVEKN